MVATPGILDGGFGAGYFMSSLAKFVFQWHIPVIEGYMNWSIRAMILFHGSMGHELLVRMNLGFVECLMFAKVWKHAIPIPAFVSQLCPPIIIISRSSYIHKIVDATRASQKLAPRHTVHLITSIGLGDTCHTPVVLFPADERGVQGRCGNILVIHEILACLDDCNFDFWVFCQSCSHN